MTELKWTNDKPKCDGHFWYREHEHDLWPEVVVVNIIVGKWASEDGNDYSILNTEGQWSNQPIPQPED